MDNLLFKGYVYFYGLSAVILGGLIYLLFYPADIYLYHWLEIINLDKIIHLVRNYTLQAYPYMPEWIVFSLPNGLWAFAYAIIITYLWWSKISPFKYFWLSSIFALGIGYELLQYLEVIPGVFCYYDLFLCLAGVSLGMIMGVNYLNKEVN